jgi:hypothetical protein
MAQKKFIIDGGFSTNADSVITGNLVMTGNVLPSINSDGVTGYDLGSPDFKWRDLFLSQGSLYIDGQKVLQSDSGTIVVSADPDQSLLTKTTGTGVLTFQSETPISIAGTLQMGVGKRITSADGLSVVFGDKIDMDSNQIINVGTPTAEGHVTTKGYVDSAITSILGGGGSAVSGTTGTFSSDVSIQGNLTVSGTTTTVNSETISLADNIIDLNSNMTSGTPTENAGIRIMRGDESAVQLRWNEATDRWTFTNDGTAYYPLVVSTTDLVEGTNLYFTDARAQAALASTVSLLQSADTTLQANITSEASTRAAADTSIRTDFGAADATLQSNIDSEEAARIAGDSATLASAQAYADSAEADAIASANAYTDGREAAITSAYQTAIAAAAEAQDELNELVDVNITSVTNGQFLRYDLGAQKWINVTANTTMIAEGTKLFFTDARAQAAVAEDIASAVTAEASDRSTADAILQVNIDTLEASLASEASTRAGAGSDLQDAIDAEATARASADTTLQGNIDTVASDLATEATARASADTTLQGNIDALTTTVNNVISNTDAAALDSLTEIVGAFQSADSTINGAITSLSGSAAADRAAIRTEFAAADVVVTTAYTDAIATAKASAISTAATDATTKADAAESAANTYTDGEISTLDASLKTYADTAEADAIAAAATDATTKVAAEATARASADTTLQGNINAEASTRASADTTLQGNIDTLSASLASEASTRASADTTLQGNINAEASTRASADTVLQGNIDTVADDVAALSADVAALTTDDVAEGSNLYYTDARVISALAAGSDVTIAGNLTVSGTTTTINTETINLADNIILLNSNATGSASQNGGIEIERGDDLNVQFIWDESNDRWTVGAESLYSAGGFIGNVTGNASTATKWATARTNTVTLTGDVTGTGNASVDGTGNWTVSLATTVAANSVALGTDTTGAYVQDVVAGSGISISESASGAEGNVATISHADTSSVANVSSNNSGGVFIQDVALTFDAYGHTTGASVATATMTNFHSGVTDINSTVASNNASGSVNITFTDLVGAVHYNVYLNRILLRPSEVTNVNTSTGQVTIATGVLATDDELEVTGLKIA